MIKNLEKIMDYVSENKAKYIVTNDKKSVVRLMPIKQENKSINEQAKAKAKRSKSYVRLQDEKKIIQEYLINKHVKNIPGYKYIQLNLYAK